jgi:hypothetical protein
MNPFKNSSHPLPDWCNKTVVVLASGPSACKSDAQKAQDAGCKVLAVNASFRLLPTCDIIYMGDHLCVKNYAAEARKASQADLWTCTPLAAEQHNAKLVRMTQETGLGREGIAQLGNSGFHAINFAFLAGCRDILLLGFDMKLGPNGEKHWHGNHPAPLLQWIAFEDWIYKSHKLADDLKANGARVVNCTPGSAMKAFPVGKLEEELCRARSS